MTMPSMPSSKWVTFVAIELAGAIVVIVDQLRADGIELPAIVTTVALIAAGLTAYWKNENRPPASARAAIKAGR